MKRLHVELCQNDGSVLTSFVYYKSEPMLGHIHNVHPTNTKHLYNIYTMLEQRRRRWMLGRPCRLINVIQLFCVCWAVAYRNDIGQQLTRGI